MENYHYKRHSHCCHLMLYVSCYMVSPNMKWNIRTILITHIIHWYMIDKTLIIYRHFVFDFESHFKNVCSTYLTFFFCRIPSLYQFWFWVSLLILSLADETPRIITLYYSRKIPICQEEQNENSQIFRYFFWDSILIRKSGQPYIIA